jgi:fumarate hydratase class II
METDFRIEQDDFGLIQVPRNALYGAHTQRAVNNFNFSQTQMPKEFIHALALVKKLAAGVNVELGFLTPQVGAAIIHAASQIVDGKFDQHFPVDVFQSGSGTSTNMNVNEVIANLALLANSEFESSPIHPIDHVNRSQSSNDVVPTAMHLACVLQIKRVLLPSLHLLSGTIDKRGNSLKGVIKTGRTHLMDAMPLSMSQELGAWSLQIQKGIQRLESTLPRLYQLAQGATAVGTGINSHPEFAQRFTKALSLETGFPFVPNSSPFESLSAQDTIVELSGQLKVIAVSLMKISNDLRWMNSGPIAGIGEIELQALQAGSSIMPGKVNPVIPEAMAMIAAHVIGNDSAITIAGQSGNFQLNVMLPLLAYKIIESINLLGRGSLSLAEKAIATFSPRLQNIEKTLALNPMLMTRLTPSIGYELAAKIVQEAYFDNRSLVEVALEKTNLDKETLTSLLDPKLMISC